MFDAEKVAPQRHSAAPHSASRRDCFCRRWRHGRRGRLYWRCRRRRRHQLMMPASRSLQQVHEGNRGERRCGYLHVRRPLRRRRRHCVGHTSRTVFLRRRRRRRRRRLAFLLFHESKFVVNVVVMLDHTHLDRSELGCTFEHICRKITEELIITHTSSVGKPLGARGHGGGVQGVVFRRFGWQGYHGH